MFSKQKQKEISQDLIGGSSGKFITLGHYQMFTRPSSQARDLNKDLSLVFDKS